MKQTIRKPWLAGLLTFPAIGLGHIYSGAAKRGLLLFIGQFCVLLLLPLIFIIPPLPAFALFLTAGVAYFIFCLVDAMGCARVNSLSYEVKKYNKWYLYVGYWLLASVIFQPLVQAGLKENLLQAYTIPSGAMQPTILIGDQILVNKLLYKRQQPQRNDIVVFKFPKKPGVDYIKRLVAVGGDTVAIKDKKLFINGIAQNEKFVRYTDKRILPAATAPRDNFGPVTVPQNSFFFLGDNRDNSYDSRFWGFVKRDAVKGKVFCLYWSWDAENSLVRWNRIGRSVD